MRTFIEKLSKFEKKRKMGFVVTVSGLSGAGKTTIAKAIANELNLKYISAGEIFRKAAKERKLDFLEFIRKRSPQFDLDVDSKILSYAMKGNVVLDGRLTGWVAGEWADFRIGVRCPVAIRAKRVAKRDKITFEKAISQIRKRDNVDMKIYKRIYKIDLLDDSIYDLIINTKRMGYNFVKNFPAKLIRDYYEDKNKSNTKRKKS